MSSRLLALNSFAPTDGAVAFLTTHPSSSRACQPWRAMSGSALACRGHINVLGWIRRKYGLDRSHLRSQDKPTFPTIRQARMLRLE